ncbi:terminase small subunit [Streptomyces cinereoruber]|uniref:terminase small subunit n=1 Tax=Streptomyces cinereoruber TaxID=67260 RepID=UPI003627EA5E
MENQEHIEEQEGEEKHPGGRPLKFQTAVELEQAIKNYFALCDPHVEKQYQKIAVDGNGNPIFGLVDILTEQKPYTMSGLARAIGVDRKTLLNYSNKEEFFPTIQDAKDRCEEFVETQLFGPHANGAKFNLINNYQGKHQDWTDKHAVDHTSKDQPLKAMVEFVGYDPTSDTSSED